MMARVPKRPPKVVGKGKNGNGNGVANGVNGTGTNGKKNGLARPREPAPKSSREKPQPKTGRALRTQEQRKPPIGRILTRSESGKPLTNEQIEVLREHARRIDASLKAEEARMKAEKNRKKRIVEDKSIPFGEKVGILSIGKGYTLIQAVQDILEEFQHFRLISREKKLYESLDFQGRIDFIYSKLIKVDNIAEYLGTLENLDLAEMVIKREISALLSKG